MSKVDDLKKTFRQEELDDIKDIASTRGGRRFLQRLFAASYIFQTTYTGEPMSTAFNEGKRSFGLQVYGDMMQVVPEKFISMTRETKEREERYGREFTRTNESDE